MAKFDVKSSQKRLDVDQDLSKEEIDKLTELIRSPLSLHDQERDFNVYELYEEEIKLGARLAKDQFSGKQFNGEDPDSGFGASPEKAGYFGWNNWNGILASMTAGTKEDVIDGGTPDNLSGSTGSTNPAVIGDYAVHVIIGVSSLATSPKMAKYYDEIGQDPGSDISLIEPLRRSDKQIKLFDEARVLIPEDEFYASIWPTADGDDVFKFLGVAFLPEKELRKSDPANMAGSGSGNIITW